MSTVTMQAVEATERAFTARIEALAKHLADVTAERDLLAANVTAQAADIEKYKTLVEDLKRDKAEVMTDLITADRELEHLRRTMASIRRDLDEAKRLVDQLRGP